MDISTEPPANREELLDQLAQAYVWAATPDSQARLAEQIGELLGRDDDDGFDLDAWAIERAEQLRGSAALLDEEHTFATRAGPHIGLVMGQWWNARNELITALQLHPGERQVLVEAGVEEVERDELIALMREEITAALRRARFLGLDALAVRLLAEEGLAAAEDEDYAALRAAAHATPTLGDGEGIRQDVRVVEVELRGEYRVRVRFDDGVARELDLAPFLRGLGLLAARRPAFFIQLRVQGGAIRWPNGAALDPALLRYHPALQPDDAGE